MLKATLLLKRRAKVSLLGRQAIADGFFHKQMQAYYLLQRIDEMLLGLSSQKPFYERKNN